ncbi:Glutathione synthetase [hydrothermal vent metagenome]|uniref:Glutathione synthetase n=1 Tax=hydrothermal vent metagenome TaxID=652676 RepID=A0A3B0ZWT7_9ZZZZ
MPIKFAAVMDPPEQLNPIKDSSLAMLEEAQRRGWQTYYINPLSLAYNEAASASCLPIKLQLNQQDWYQLSKAEPHSLGDIDIIIMRKDPPFNMNYIYATYLLELAEKQGALVINRPQSLRDANEKLFTLQFPECCAPTLVASDISQLKAFLDQYGDIIVKPLDGMGGASIFRIKQDDPNIAVIFETMTQYGQTPIIAQRFIPEISEGDKRILLIDGEPIPYALARIPAKGETRGNLAAGGSGVGVPLTERDLWICKQVGPTLRKMGLSFVGIDVIGDYLTEINVTSPTCIRELDKLYDLNISKILLDALEAKIK